MGSGGSTQMLHEDQVIHTANHVRRCIGRFLTLICATKSGVGLRGTNHRNG